MDRKEFQARLIIFSVDASELTLSLKPGPTGNNMALQLAKSSTSTALNYAESQSAESTKDFIHNLP